jgi:carboxymethylenebutenolidase
MTGSMASPVLAIFGAADQGIPPSVIDEFETALQGAGVDHRIVTYPGAPHGFFDRKSGESAEASEAAWEETLSFVRTRTSAPD